MLEAGQTYQLEDDVVIKPHVSSDLPEGYMIFRRHGRGAPVYTSQDALSFVEQFKTPSTIAAAISRYSSEIGVSSSEVLNDTIIIAQHLADKNLLRLANGAGRRFSWLPEVGGRLGEWQVTHAIRTMDESAAFFCKSTKTGVDAFLKVFDPASQYGLSLFENETKILEQITGTHAPRLLEVNAEADLRYFVMTRAPGRTLATFLNSEWSLESRLQTCKTLLKAYAILHRQGILHADVHDGNIMVAGEQLTIVDFGASRSNRFPSSIEGRPIIPYCYEPEAALALANNRPAGPPTEKGEQYSVAALIFRILTGADYLEFSSDTQTLYRQIALSPPRQLIDFSIRSPSVQAVLDRALQKQPAGRYRSMDGFLRAFRRAVGRGIALDKRHAVWRLVSDPPPRLPKAPTASVNFGASGVAMACLRLSTLRGQREFLPLADRWMDVARREIESRGREAFFDEKGELSDRNVGPAAPLHRQTGVDLVDIMRMRHWGETARADKALQALALPDPGGCNPDLFTGDFGLVLALLEIGAADSGQESWLREMVPAGLRRALENFTGKGTGDYGLAHGMGGVLYVACRYMEKFGELDGPEFEILKTRFLAGHSRYGGQPRWRWGVNSDGHDFYMPGLCSGDAGHALILLELMKHDTSPMISQALDACLTRLSSPGSWKAGHICCGAAGGAIALAEAGKVLDKSRWAKAALQISKMAIDLNFSDPAYSLMKGAIGAYLVEGLLKSASTGSSEKFGFQSG